MNNNISYVNSVYGKSEDYRIKNNSNADKIEAGDPDTLVEYGCSPFVQHNGYGLASPSIQSRSSPLRWKMVDKTLL